VSSTCTRRAAPGMSSTSRIAASGRPTSDTHRLQIVWGFTGALPLMALDTFRLAGPPFIEGPQTPLTSEAPVYGSADTCQIPHYEDLRRHRNCPSSAVHNFGTLPPEALNKMTLEHSFRSWGTNESTK